MTPKEIEEIQNLLQDWSKRIYRKNRSVAIEIRYFSLQLRKRSS